MPWPKHDVDELSDHRKRKLKDIHVTENFLAKALAGDQKRERQILYFAGNIVQREGEMSQDEVQWTVS